MNYKFQNIEEPGDLTKEVLGRLFVRQLNSFMKVQIQQLNGDSWTQLRVLTPGKLQKLFTNFKDKSLTLKKDSDSVYVYIDSNVTAIDVRMLIDEILYKYKHKDDSKLYSFRAALANFVLKLARKIYPK